MDKQNVVHIHTMEYFSVIKRNEVLIHATTWMNLENMMQSKRNQTQKNHILHDSIFNEMPQQVKP